MVGGPVRASRMRPNTIVLEIVGFDGGERAQEGSRKQLVYESRRMIAN
jgi:hypothetical protein